MADQADVDKILGIVLIGIVPLMVVTSLKLEEGYTTVQIAGSTFTQMIRPSKKKIILESLLIKEWRALRPALEAMALTSRALAAATGFLTQVTGIPVVSKSFVSLDMQVTSLTFTQDNKLRDTLKVNITLEHVPRSRITELISAALDLAVGVGTAFIP